nr:MAG TPA: hypothetical protein [Bacteriophage sp.]
MLLISLILTQVNHGIACKPIELTGNSLEIFLPNYYRNIIMVSLISSVW